jgi:hypothetical protein
VLIPNAPHAAVKNRCGKPYLYITPDTVEQATRNSELLQVKCCYLLKNVMSEGLRDRFSPTKISSKMVAGGTPYEASSYLGARLVAFAHRAAGLGAHPVSIIRPTCRLPQTAAGNDSR